PPSPDEHADSRTPTPNTATPEPPILRIIIDSHWKLDRARPQLPPVQVVHEKHLETQDWIEHAYDGGKLRLFVSAGDKNDIFAVLVDTRDPKYASFAQPFFAEHYAVFHHAPYAVVVPVHPVSQEQFTKLKAKLWTEEGVRQQLGVPSYHWF